MSPQDQVAQHFMAHKGYGDIEPYDIEKLDGHPTWYYLYHLLDGSTLELEVCWTGSEWDTVVTAFALAE